ncbi:MAG: LON peptidase substrate-binding domain-containing protein [Candidatus Eremiobacteraeota bacterium]|nr:LON peptidase substrate-binding domain-containing protein [Candidatus Eremiobacteraeota bacterium]
MIVPHSESNGFFKMLLQRLQRALLDKGGALPWANHRSPMPNQRLRLFPLNTVLFPGATLDLHVFEPRYKQLIDECLQRHEPFGVVLIRDGNEAGNSSVIPHDVGTAAQISHLTPLPFERYYVSTLGSERFRIERIVSREPYLTVEVEYLPDELLEPDRLRALADDVRVVFADYLQLLVALCGSEANVDLPTDARGISYIVGGALQIGDTHKQRLLELTSTKQRLTAELRLLRRLLPQLRTLLERRQQAAARRLSEIPEDSGFRLHQEELFGKHFSLN